jgi:hypothetical protein
MRTTVALIFFILASCVEKSEEKKLPSKTTLEISVIDSKFPLLLSNIDFQDNENLVKVNDEINSGILKTVTDFYNSECGNDCEGYFSLSQSYIATIRLVDKDRTMFVIVLQGFPVRDLICKILFYDNISKKMIDQPIDFKIFALYDFNNGKLFPSNLKDEFEIKNPEIELVDFDNDGINEFKLTRLFHNGTFNAIDTRILKISNEKVELVEHKQKGIGKYSQQ